MTLHLAEISRGVATRAHAVPTLDGAHDRVVPADITLPTLPACAPELDPVENVWQFLRQNWLGDRIFASCDDLVDRCRHPRGRLVARPRTIMSLGPRSWTLQIIIFADRHTSEPGPSNGRGAVFPRRQRPYPPADATRSAVRAVPSCRGRCTSAHRAPDPVAIVRVLRGRHVRLP